MKTGGEKAKRGTKKKRVRVRGINGGGRGGGEKCLAREEKRLGRKNRKRKKQRK